MKKFLPIFIIAFIVVIVGAAGLNLLRDKQAAKEPFGGPLNLVTMDGQPFSENDLRAAPAAIFFGFTHCPDVCPTTLYELDGWLKQLGPEGSAIKAYFITVDPERDTQEVMKTYVGNVSDRIMRRPARRRISPMWSSHITSMPRRCRAKTANIRWIIPHPYSCSTRAVASAAPSPIRKTRIRLWKS
jgi:hypothetical protein